MYLIKSREVSRNGKEEYLKECGINKTTADNLHLDMYIYGLY